MTVRPYLNNPTLAKLNCVIITDLMQLKDLLANLAAFMSNKI